MNDKLVWNLKFDHPDTQVLTEALGELDKVFALKLSKWDHYRYSGKYFQLRMDSFVFNQLTKQVNLLINKYQLHYWMVLGSGLKNTPLSLNKSFCDALVESGTIFDRIIKSKRNNVFVYYDFGQKKLNKHYKIASIQI